MGSEMRLEAVLDLPVRSVRRTVLWPRVSTIPSSIILSDRRRRLHSERPSGPPSNRPAALHGQSIREGNFAAPRKLDTACFLGHKIGSLVGRLEPERDETTPQITTRDAAVGRASSAGAGFAYCLRAQVRPLVFRAQNLVHLPHQVCEALFVGRHLLAKLLEAE